MIKYPEKIRLRAVRAYLSGHSGLRAVAEEHGVGFDSLRQWVASFREHGVAGIRVKARKEYDIDFKLMVLRRIRDDGLSYREAGALYDIRRFNWIGVWERAYEEKGLAGLMPTPKATTSKMKKSASCDQSGSQGDDQRSRKDLLQELQQLRMENAYLKKADALVQDKSKSARKRKR